MTTSSRTDTRADRLVHRVGLWCLAAGLLGAAQAIVILAWPPQVPDTRFSYPFTGTGYVVAQLSFFVQHLPLVAAMAALPRLPAVRRSRIATIGIVVAALGLGLLCLNELFAISAHDVATGSDHADLVETLYGPPVILIGIGLLVSGVVLLCRGTAPWAAAAWMPGLIALIGFYVFVPLTPAITGSFVAGRLGIGGWMLLFGVLGYGLTQLSPAHDHDSRARSGSPSTISQAASPITLEESP
jgi:hypothetical protein